MRLFIKVVYRMVKGISKYNTTANAENGRFLGAIALKKLNLYCIVVCISNLIVMKRNQ